jgi:hypothetical protein
MFPAEPRPLPARRGLKVLLRSLHVLCTGLLTGSYLFGAEAPSRTFWWLAAIVTGLLILLLDLHESGVFLLQVRGLVVVAKFGALASLPLLDGLEAWVLSALVVVSVLSSHAPSRIRYLVVAGSGRGGAKSKG